MILPAHFCRCHRIRWQPGPEAKALVVTTGGSPAIFGGSRFPLRVRPEGRLYRVLYVQPEVIDCGAAWKRWHGSRAVETQ